MLLLTLFACDGDGPVNPGTPLPDDILTEVWEVDGLSWDLGVRDGQLLSTTQFGGQIWGWDGSDEEQVGDRLGEVQAVAVDGDTVYFTVTDSGMTGFVARLDDVRKFTVLADSGDGGLPMRRPEDLVLGPDGALYVADPGAEAVWRVETDGSSAKIVTRDIEALSVGFHAQQLHYGTPDGVYAWDDGTESAITVHDFPGWGLLSDEGALLVGSEGGVYEDGDLIAPTDEGMRLASMVRWDNEVYVTDQGQGSVWSFKR